MLTSRGFAPILFRRLTLNCDWLCARRPEPSRVWGLFCRRSSRWATQGARRKEIWA